MTWFAVEIDRCFEYKHYGEGIRIYSDSLNNERGYIVPETYHYVNSELFIEGQDSVFQQNRKIYKIKIESEPNEKYFKNYLSKWRIWDAAYGEFMGEDRSDFKPLEVQNINELLLGLKLKIE